MDFIDEYLLDVKKIVDSIDRKTIKDVIDIIASVREKKGRIRALALTSVGFYHTATRSTRPGKNVVGRIFSEIICLGKTPRLIRRYASKNLWPLY